MSSVIEDLLYSKRSEANQYCIAYFYFKHNRPDKETYNGLLRAILEQLIDQDSAMSDHLFGELSSIDGVNLRSTKTLEKYVKAALESYRISYVVLDGLDECVSGDATKSVGLFSSLVNGGLSDTTAILRVIFCGRRDGVLDKLLSNQPSISLEASGHFEDIHRYCQGLCKLIREKFGIPQSMEEEIVLRVTNKAHGILYLNPRSLAAGLIRLQACSSTRVLC